MPIFDGCIFDPAIFDASVCVAPVVEHRGGLLLGDRAMWAVPYVGPTITVSSRVVTAAELTVATAKFRRRRTDEWILGFISDQEWIEA